MYNIGIHYRMKQIIAIIYWLDIWQNEKISSQTLAKIRTKKIFYLIMFASFFLSLLFGMFLCDDKNGTIFLAAASGSILVLNVKLNYILWLQEDICTLIQNIGTHSTTDRNEFIKINRKNNIVMNFSTIFFILALLGTTPIFVVSLPIFSNERNLALKIAFPLDWRNSEIIYWTAYLYMLYNLLCGIACVLVTVIIWYLMINCSIKYESLGKQFINLGARPIQQTKVSEAEQTLFFQELLNLIEIHQKLRTTIDSFGSSFNLLFFTQITTSGIITCGSLYVLTFANHSFILTASYGAALIYSMFDIFIVMYFGNEIEVLSNQLSYCVFTSNWTGQSKSSKKCMLILTEMLTHPQQLIICKMYPLNLKTFTSIINFTYTMFNILINLKPNVV